MLYRYALAVLLSLRVATISRTNEMIDCECANPNIDMKFHNISIGKTNDSLIAGYFNLSPNTYSRKKYSFGVGDKYSSVRLKSPGNYYARFYYQNSISTDQVFAELQRSKLFYIEVGLAGKGIDLKYGIPTDENLIKNLSKTGRGAYLGMKIEDFVAQYSDMVFTRATRFRQCRVLEFICDPNANSLSDEISVQELREFPSEGVPNKGHFRVRQINQSCNYIARYVFLNDTLVKIGFGYMPEHPSHDFEDLIY